MKRKLVSIALSAFVLAQAVPTMAANEIKVQELNNAQNYALEKFTEEYKDEDYSLRDEVNTFKAIEWPAYGQMDYDLAKISDPDKQSMAYMGIKSAELMAGDSSDYKKIRLETQTIYYGWGPINLTNGNITDVKFEYYNNDTGQLEDTGFIPVENLTLIDPNEKLYEGEVEINIPSDAFGYDINGSHIKNNTIKAYFKTDLSGWIINLLPDIMRNPRAYFTFN